jgi:cysteine-rich repeat protein
MRGYRLGLVAVAAWAAAWAAACSVKPDWTGSQFSCANGEGCPPEYLCVATHCQPRIDGPTIDAPIDADPLLCGNGDLDPGEECDDANDSNSDLCVEGCRFARCGDSFMRTAVEECDDGNTSAGDLCNPVCRTCTAGAARFTYPVTDACFIRFDVSGTFDASAQSCATSGAHLAIYETAGESDAVAVGLGLPSSRWIGMDDRDTEGTFVWLNGLVLGGDDDWGGTEPNGDTTENCVTHTASGDWADTGCGSSQAGYVCEDEGWLISPTDAHAYRFLYQTTSWTSARDVCTGLGGHLATIESAAENDLIAARVKKDTFLGGNDLATQGDYVWLTGETMTYENWSTGEPDDTLGAEDCMTMGATGQWSDSDCAGPLVYVCEVE